jgi:hypothetical protein
MQRYLSYTTCAITLALGTAVFAQGDADYQKWMKTAGGTAGSVRKNIEAKNGEAASADAKKLEEVFKQVHDYWHGKGVQDAMTLAMDASAKFKEVAEFASGGKFDDAAASLKNAMSNCATCHNAHREKAADGSWKMK